jgi:hypothetical protein
VTRCIKEIRITEAEEKEEEFGITYSSLKLPIVLKDNSNLCNK